MHINLQKKYYLPCNILNNSPEYNHPRWVGTERIRMLNIIKNILTLVKKIKLIPEMNLAIIGIIHNHMLKDKVLSSMCQLNIFLLLKKD